jgi:hypothetical protein
LARPFFSLNIWGPTHDRAWCYYDAILKDCKIVEVPGEGLPKEDIMLTPQASVLEETGQADAPAKPPHNE